MKILNENSWERYDHFVYYEEKIRSGYTMTAKLDVSNLEAKATNECKISDLIYYCIMKAINRPENINFRVFKSEDLVFAYSEMHALFTIFHDDDKTFSNVWAPYYDDVRMFCRGVEETKRRYAGVHGVSVTNDKPKNCVPISIIPWIHFESFCTDRYSEGANCFPIITLSKIEDSKITMSVYVKHSVADGYHTAKLLNDVQSAIDKLEV